jgi:hypothetical protein
MLQRSEYIEWITAHYAGVAFNLAATGVPSLSVEERALFCRNVRWHGSGMSLKLQAAELAKKLEAVSSELRRLVPVPP